MQKAEMKQVDPEWYFQEYNELIVQRYPKYSVAPIGSKEFREISYPMPDYQIRRHLAGEITLAGVAPWYPKVLGFDLDHKDLGYVENLREELGLNVSNSMLFASQRPGCYYLYIRPVLNGVPTTRYRVNEIFKAFAKIRGFEVYPKVNKCGRLPLGFYSKPLDYEHQYIETWQDKLFQMLKLDEFELSSIRWQQFELPFTARPDNSLPLMNDAISGSGWYAQGHYLLKNGLQEPSSRNESQAKVIYYLFRQNMHAEHTIQEVWSWVQAKHNGYSKDIVSRPKDVFGEIQRQTAHIYNNYQWNGTYPDTTHNSYFGYISRPDLETILMVNKGSIPRSKFLSGIVKYCNPRRYRDWVNIRTGTQWADRDKGYSADTLRDMGGKGTITKYMREFEEKGILKRSKSYRSGHFSKSIKLNWDWKTDKDGSILYGGRSITSWETTIKNAFSDPRDFKGLLRAAGTDKAYIRRILRDIYNPS